MKKSICILLLFIMIGIISGSHMYAADISVRLDGNSLEFDQPPVIQNNRTLVPLRAIFESLGTQVDWDEKTKTVTASKNNTTISLKIGSKMTKVNGKVIYLDQEAVVINDRTLVPLRFIGESLGAEVSWDENTQTVDLSSPKEFRLNSID